MSRIARIAAVIVIYLLPLGCAGLLDPGPPLVDVLLPVALPQPSSAGRLPVQLLVARPATDPATGTNRIMALMNGFEVKALDSARWAGPVPYMVQRQLVDALESTRRLAAVGWEESSLDARYRLGSDIRRFYLRYDTPDKPPVADVLIVFALVDPETGKFIARRLVRAEEACTDNSLKAFVDAFSRAMTQVYAETTSWVIEQMETVASSRTPKAKP